MSFKLYVLLESFEHTYNANRCTPKKVGLIQVSTVVLVRLHDDKVSGLRLSAIIFNTPNTVQVTNHAQTCVSMRYRGNTAMVHASYSK